MADLLHEARPMVRKKARSDPVGILALVATVAGLACLSAQGLCAAVMPLSIAGLVLGFLGWVRVFGLGGVRILPPVGALILSGLTLVTATACPMLLGPNYRAYRMGDALDSQAVRIIPFPGSALAAVPARNAWVEANQASLQQGSTIVQVLRVSFGPRETTIKTRSKLPPDDFVVIRLRARIVADGSESQADRMTAQEHKLATTACRLFDGGDRVHHALQVRAQTESTSGRRTPVFPVTVRDWVVVFPAADPGSQGLRLEVQTSETGADATVFRFRIPPAMIRYEPTSFDSGGR